MLLFQILLIALNAVFACAEIAVISISDAKLEKLAEDGDKRAKKLLKLTSQPAKFLSTIQVAITLAGFLGSAFAAENFSEPIVKWLTVDLGVKIPTATLETISIVVITLILSYFTLVFGELVPKRVAMRNSEKLGLSMAKIISFLSVLFAPIVWLLTISTNCVLRLMGIDPNKDDNDVSEEDIRVMVDSGAKSGSIDDEERDLIQNIFEFDDLTAGDIATHRTDVTILWTDEDEDEWEEIIHERCHMFYPVCNESADDVVGVLYLKDYFRLSDHSRENVMEKAVKKPYFVPENVKADVLFRNMKTEGKTFAVVLDEYGGMRGIITMNDLLGKLVGDIGEDSSTKDEEVSLTEIGERTWKLIGNVPLEEIVEKLGVELPIEDSETFSGMVFSEYGSIPDDGTTFELEAWGLTIKVSLVNEHLIEEATIICPEKLESDEGDEKDDE